MYFIYTTDPNYRTKFNFVDKANVIFINLNYCGIMRVRRMPPR